MRCFSSVLRRAVVAVAVTAAGLVAGCADGGGGPDRSDDGVLQIVAAFYPLQFVAERVGGDRVDVQNLTPLGAEPHDVELTGRDIARLGEADLVVNLGGFSGAVDAALRSLGAGHVLDVAPSALDGRADPHFWLDPLRLAAAGDIVAARLAELDPGGAEAYGRQAAALRADLTALDGELAAGLRDCASRQIVTGHDAFGYLADRYSMTQIAISGLTPDDEPSARDLADVVALIRSTGVTTVYSETLVSPAVAEAVGRESGARVAVLDPLEGLAEGSQGADYLSVMRSNLETLRAGQGCR